MSNITVKKSVQPKFFDNTLVTLNWPNKNILKNPFVDINIEDKEIFFKQDKTPWSNWFDLLVHGDNLELLNFLKNKKKFLNKFGGIKLIYIDPPFATGNNQNLEIKSSLKDEYISSYEDKWQIDKYLSMIYQRLYWMHKLLDDNGTIFVHCDWRTSGYLRLILDELFGKENFANEIIWKSSVSNSSKKLKKFVKSHDTIFVYHKTNKFIWNDVYQSYSSSQYKIYKYEDEIGKYQLGPCDAPGGGGYKYDLGYKEKTPSRGYSMPIETAKKWIDQGILIVNKGCVPLKKWYLNEKGVKCQDIWCDIERERGLIYATQKPVNLLERIIKSSSNEGDIVADFFCGSGTSLLTANKLNRKFIGSDTNITAIHSSKIRLLNLNKESPLLISNISKPTITTVYNLASKNNNIIKQAKIKLIRQLQKIDHIENLNSKIFINYHDSFQNKDLNQIILEVRKKGKNILCLLSRDYDYNSLKKLILKNPDITILPYWYQAETNIDINTLKKFNSLTFWDIKIIKSKNNYKFNLIPFKFSKNNKYYENLNKPLEKIIDFWSIGEKNIFQSAYIPFWSNHRVDRRKAQNTQSPFIKINKINKIKITVSDILGYTTALDLDFKNHPYQFFSNS